MDPLASALQYLKGVGPRRAADLQRVGLDRRGSAVRFPMRYEDRGAFRTIASLRPGMVASIMADVISSGVRLRPGGRASRSSRCWCAIEPAPRGLVQSAVPRRRLPSPSTCRPVRQAGAVHARPAAPESSIRDRPRRGADESVDGETPAPGDTEGLHRPHRADLRKDRHADDQDAADAGVPGAGAASAGIAGSSSPTSAGAST